MQLQARRDFLKHSALIAATLSSTGMPRSFLRADDKPVAPSEKLRVAVLGVHGRGMSHVNGFAGRNGCEVVTVCDPDEAVIGPAMKEVEKKQGKAPAYERDIRKVMADKSIDIVSIATPNHWHALAAIWALQAGKDVYVEKPVSHNVSEGRRIVEAARKYNRICQAGTQSRSMPGMRAAIAAVQGGKIGTVKLAYGTCYKRRPSIGKVDGPQPIPKSIDYDLWCGPAPKTPLMRKHLHYDWHWIWDYGCGDLGNQGIHEMDKARWGLGKMTLPNTVVSIGGRYGYLDDGQTANTQVCLYDYGDSELIFEVRGLVTPDFKGSMVGNVFMGSDGFVVCPSYSSGTQFDMDGKKVAEFKGGGGDGNHFDNFIKGVRSRKSSDLNGDILEGHLSSALCHLGNISLRLGKVEPLAEVAQFTEFKPAQDSFQRMVEHLKKNNVDPATAQTYVGPVLAIDPKTEQFANGSAKHNALLTREYRQGFEVPEKV